MKHAAIIKARLDELRVRYDDFGKNRLSAIIRTENGSDVMVTIEEPVKFGSLFVTEFWGLLEFYPEREIRKQAKKGGLLDYLLEDNVSWPMGHWAIRDMGDAKGVSFSIKLLSDGDAFDLTADEVNMALTGVVHVVATTQEHLGIE